MLSNETRLKGIPEDSVMQLNLIEMGMIKQMKDRLMVKYVRYHMSTKHIQTDI